jgi:hypothetical protein
MPRLGYRKGIDDKKEPLQKPFPLRLPKSVQDHMKAEANARSLTMAELARKVLAAHTKADRASLPHKKGPTRQTIHQLARIGNNLNQLARQANAGYVGVSEVEIRDALAVVNQVAARL